MPKYAQHPNSQVRILLDGLSPWESCAPTELQTFLMELNLTGTKDEAWELFRSLSERLGMGIVTYGFLWRRTHAHADVVLRSNLPEEWKEFSDAIPNFTYFDYGRMHIGFKPTCFFMWSEFEDLFEGAEFFTQDYRQVFEQAAKLGYRSGIFIPLRSGTRGEVGGASFSSSMNRQEFLNTVNQHGWTMHVAAWAMHTTYLAHLREEEAAMHNLTEREMDFLRLSANGLEIKEIAYRWGTSAQYATKVCRSVCSKFGLTSKMAVMAKAVRLNMLLEDDFVQEEGHTTLWV